MAEAVAGEGGVGVGAVFAPGLVEVAEVELDLVAAHAEQGAKDASLGAAGDGDGDDGMDAAQAFGPGAAEELEEDGLGLVVGGVRGEDCVCVAGPEEVVEGAVAEGAGGFFQGFAGGDDVGGDVGAVEVEGDVELSAEVGDKGLVDVGFVASDAVVDVDGGESDAQGGFGSGVGGVEGAEEGDGVGSAGDGDG